MGEPERSLPGLFYRQYMTEHCTCATSDYCQVHDEIDRLTALLGETNEALSACQSEGSAWKRRAEYLEAQVDCLKFLQSGVGEKKLYWAAVAVANSIRLGIGGMIRGTAQEQDLRDALWMAEDEIRDCPKGSTTRIGSDG
jgi:hypothetical protein